MLEKIPASVGEALHSRRAGLQQDSYQAPQQVPQTPFDRGIKLRIRRGEYRACQTYSGWRGSLSAS
jgi:hypothetical protein